MKKTFFLLLIAACKCVLISSAQSNYVSGGGEVVNFGTINLATPSGQIWSTARTASPGYFSAYYPGASFSGASDATNVNGYVKKYGNQAFTFPVGTGADLRSLSISAPSSASDAYGVAWILGDPNVTGDPTNGDSFHPVTSVTGGLTQVSHVGQWDWVPSSGTGAGLTITVSIPDMTSFALTPNLRLAGWNGSAWVDLSNASTASGNTENSTLSGTMIAGIQAIGIGTITFVLPLHLLSFSSTREQCNAALQWTTSEEANTSHFDIEESIDGNRFEKTGTLPAVNNTAIHVYTYNTPLKSNRTYYRLKMIDIDGRYEYSKVISVQSVCSLENFLTVFPNPVTSDNENLAIKFKLAYSGNINMTIMDATGRRMHNKLVTASSRGNSEVINVSRLSRGSYFIYLLDKDGQLLANPSKFIKK